MAGQHSTLLGRERELAALAGALDRASAAAGAVTLVTGEPGIGKTSLLDATAARAAEQGFTVTWGRAWEVGGAPAHWIWIEALRPLVASLDDPAAERVKSLVLDATAAAPDSFHLCDAIAQLVRRCAERAPLLIVFDDLHAADISSLEIVLFVARQLSGTRAAIAGSYRDVEARMSKPVEDALAKIGRLGEVVSVARLEQAEVGELVRATLGSDDPRVAEMVMSATEGNPLFVHELLRLLAAKASAPAGVPSGVRAVIRERLALLSPATVALLQAAAVAGRECSVALAAAVAGVTAEALEEAAAEATAAALLEHVGPGRLRFSHALVAETLAGELAAPVRARMHRKAAEVLEQLHADDPIPPAAEIAHHWLLAGTGSAARAVDAAERAAQVAAERLAFSDAAELLERALGALAVADPAANRRRAELLLQRCAALTRAGERAAAEDLCREAAELARALGDGELFARVALALGAELMVGHSDAVVKQVLQEASERLPAGDSALRARVTARLAAARQPSENVRGPIADALAAIDMARRLGDDEVLLYTLYAGMAALADYAPAAQRLPLNREAAVLAAAQGRADYELRARTRILFDCVELVDRLGFAAELQELDALVHRLGVSKLRWMSLVFHSMQAGWEGRFEDSNALYAEAEALAGPNVGPFRFPAREVLCIAARDRHDSFDRELEVLSTIRQSITLFAELMEPMALCRAGRVDEARAKLPAFLSEVTPTRHEIHLLHILAELAWHLRDRVIAERAYEHLESRLGTAVAVTGMGYWLQTTTDHLCMRLAIVLERWHDVDRYGASALELAERLGARVLAVHVYTDWATGLAARGTEPARAAELARTGAALAEELGMTNPLARCRRVVEGAPVAAQTGSEALSLTLEGDYWTVTGFGEVCRIKDSRGMQMLSELIARPGEEIHSLELSGAGVADGGDAGELLDDDARDAYRSRLRELAAELEEAESFNDPGRRDRAQAEIDALTAELSRAFGMGGRKRRAGVAAERARSNVRRRLADAMTRIADAAPAIGAHLDDEVSTGVYCSYRRP